MPGKVPRSVGGKASRKSSTGGAARTSRPASGVKMKRRNKPGTVALREIRRYQKSSDLLLHKAPFMRLVRHIQQQMENSGRGTIVSARFQKSAIFALQHAAEAYLTGLYQDGVSAMIHAKRVTLQKKDFDFVMNFRDRDATGHSRG